MSIENESTARRVVATLDELETNEKLLVTIDDVPVLVLWNEGDPVALADTCIHKERSLSRGVVFNGRIVCPGHQWSFDLQTGFCKERDRYQPTYRTEVVDGQIVIDPTAVTVHDTIEERA